MEFYTLAQSIALCADRAPHRMLQVANYVLACPETIALGSVDSAASATGASPASLVRFCQFIGLTGFAQLREILRNELLRSLRIAREDHSRASDSHKLTLQRVVSLTIRALEELDGSLSEEALCDFIDVLKRAGTIFITGDGRCYPIAVVLHQMLGEMRIRSYLATRDESSVEAILGFAEMGDALAEIALGTLVAGASIKVSARLVGPIPPSEQARSAKVNTSQLTLSQNGCVDGSALALCHALARRLADAKSVRPKNSPAPWARDL